MKLLWVLFKMLQCIKIITALLVFASLTNARPDKVVCYFGSWTKYRQGDGQFTVQHIDAEKCTHAIYAFVGINLDGSIRLLDPANDQLTLPQFVALKQKNPKIKTMVAIGGWNENSGTFSAVAASAALRLQFAGNALAFLQLYGLDGFDLDWEYPAQRGGSPNDRQNVNLLLEALRHTFDASGKKYLLSAAVAAAEASAAISYALPEFATSLDFINLMAYDFHGYYEGVTGQNAPLYASTVDTNRGLNVDAAVKAWIAKGAPPEKIVLGMPLYGRSYTVLNANVHGLNNPANAGTPGPFTAEAGMLGYNEICAMQLQGGWSEVWDDEQKVPYAYKGNQWVGFDNEHSIRIKCEYAIELNLGGGMVWSIDSDDFHGRCGRPYPLLSTINEVFFGQPNQPSQPNTTTTVKPNTITTTTPPKPNEGPICAHDGFNRDQQSCETFYICQGGIILAKQSCPRGLVFNTQTNTCDYPQNVPDCQLLTNLV